MIIRILNEGQYRCDDSTLEALNAIDDRVEAAVEAKDDAAFRSALEELHEAVVSHGAPVEDDYIGESDLVLPDVDSTIEEIASMMGEEGLIPD